MLSILPKGAKTAKKRENSIIQSIVRDKIMVESGKKFDARVALLRISAIREFFSLVGILNL